jgi:hypothetical protein
MNYRNDVKSAHASDQSQFFAGSREFTVRKIKVIEITN